MREVILSKPLSMKLARMSDAAIRGALKRGRLVEGDAYIEGVVHQGITFDSLAAYCGWAPKTCDEILIAHMVPQGARAFLTERDPGESVRAMTYGDAARRAEVEATYSEGDE